MFKEDLKDLLLLPGIGSVALMTDKILLRYTMLIEWSEEDQAYLVTLPEWKDRVIMPATHGNTYSDAMEQGQKVLEMLVKNAQEEGENLPQPGVYVAILPVHEHTMPIIER